MASLSAWQNFYVIVGAASATLTGLMFVVITLIAGTRVQRSSNAVNAFSTPTLIHFCAALLVAALSAVPWEHSWQPAWAFGLIGFAAMPYMARVGMKLRRTLSYQPVLEDWLTHLILPTVSYIVLLAAGIILPRNPSPALYAIGAVTLMLIFIGVHNAWDTITYLVLEYGGQPDGAQQDK